MTNEEWREISGFPGYFISDLGSVRTTVSRTWNARQTAEPRPVKPVRGKNGYLSIFARDASGKRRQLLVHRVVLQSFVGECPIGMLARHVMDSDKTNNALWNLAWGTQRENMLDAQRHGSLCSGARRSELNRTTGLRGEHSPHSKLTDAGVREIRSSAHTAAHLAKTLGVSAQTVRAAKSGRTWSHV